VTAAPKSSLFRKTLHTLATLLITQGSTIAAGIATARAFGPSGKGVLALAFILVTFAVTTGEGVKSAVAFQIGREKRDSRAVWGAALKLIFGAAPIGTAVLLVLWRLQPAQPAYLYAALAFPFALYVQSVGVLYLLRDRVERINVQNTATIGAGVSIATLALVTLVHASVAVLLAVWVASYVAATIWAASGVRELIGGAPILRGGGLLRQQVTFGSKISLSSNVTFLALRIDVFIVSAMLSPALLGIYTLALASGEVLYNLSRAILWSSTGQVAMLEFENSAALCARIVRSIVAMQFAAGLILFAFGPWLIDLVYGSRFAESGSVLRLLLPGIIFYSADGMLSYFIAVRAGRPGLLLALECVTLVLIAGITFVSITRLGIYAGALGHTTAFLVSYALKATIFVRLSGLRARDVLLPRLSDLPYALRSRLRVAGT
jgi:O-antigen/teichoic acid export membrane protein